MLLAGYFLKATLLSETMHEPGCCRYILPALSLIPAEAEESVRVEYAGILAQLAATAHRFVMRLQMPAAPTQQQVQSHQHLPQSCRADRVIIAAKCTTNGKKQGQ